VKINGKNIKNKSISGKKLKEPDQSRAGSSSRAP
jgi:hypothetical protein